MDVENTWSRPSQRASRPFPARFSSECSGCGDLIEEGDQIRMYLGDPYHEDEDNPCLPAEVRR